MRITVIIPTYNYGDQLPFAIESVRSNGYNPDKIELIIVDDGSVDNTKAVVHELMRDFPIVYLMQSNLGKAEATRKGIAAATGDIIFNLDADDWFLPGKISRTVEIFEKFPSVTHVATPALVYVGREDTAPAKELIPPSLLNKELEGAALLSHFLNNNLLYGGGSTFAARSGVLKSIPWSQDIDMYTDEWLLINTLLAGKSYLISEPLSVWLVHQRNYSTFSKTGPGQKQHRSAKSSASLLRILREKAYPEWLINLYSLKHALRLQKWRELEGANKIKWRYWFLVDYILSGRYTLTTLWKYKAFNRLIR